MALRRTLGTRDITLFAIACIVGTRWIATAAHAGPGSIVLWVIAAVCFAVPLAIATASLTVRHPEAGGIYIWTRHDFGPWHGFLAFWLYWMGTIAWFPGAAMFYVGVAAGQHLIMASLAAIWIALGANIFGVKSGQRIADLGGGIVDTGAVAGRCGVRFSNASRRRHDVPATSRVQLEHCGVPFDNRVGDVRHGDAGLHGRGDTRSAAQRAARGVDRLHLRDGLLRRRNRCSADPAAAGSGE